MAAGDVGVRRGCKTHQEPGPPTLSAKRLWHACRRETVALAARMVVPAAVALAAVAAGHALPTWHHA
jgi:hypothetical protein